MLAALVFVTVLLGGGTPAPLQNAGFEEKAAKDAAPPGWTLEMGAQNGATKPESEVALDAKEKHGGKASLRLSGDANTRGWRILKQPIEVRPGGTYVLEAWTKTAGVKPNGFGLDNCYVGVFFFDAEDKAAGIQRASPSLPDSGWTKLSVTVTPTAKARKGYVYVFLSMLGDLWVDDLALTIEGGERIPAPVVVLQEDFAKLKQLGADWKKKVGATNGTGGEDSKARVDVTHGCEGSPNSLQLGGNVNTMRWTHLVRELPAEPGDLFRWSALAKCENVRREGVQFGNQHINLLFVDGKGTAIGAARFAHLEPGTHDWTPLAVDGVAPEGAKKVQVGVFLSMSGDAWFDRFELTREKGLPVPYGDWITLAGKGVTLRYSPQDPHANEMKAKLSALEQSKRTTCRALEVEFDDMITVLLYADNAQGKLLTGADLDFADPQNRRVHQQWDSFIGHEMVHVIAHNALQYGKTGILGEGIAVWLNGQMKNHHTLARELLEKKELPSVADLVLKFRDAKNNYPAAGSFTGFLIETYGLAVFKQIYPLEDPSAKLKELKGKSFEELEPEWHALLAKN